MEHKRIEEHENTLDAFEALDAIVDQDDLDPFEINFLPQFRQGRGRERPFINPYGVVIGDHEYVSEQSPLEQWTENTDPAIMAGDDWVHPFKDVGFQTTENREYFEQGIKPQSGIFMHLDKNVAYEASTKPAVEETEMNENPSKNTD
ncbi:MAG: DUF3905 domain-containing protein [Paenibacillaceae bacterium]